MNATDTATTGIGTTAAATTAMTVGTTETADVLALVTAATAIGLPHLLVHNLPLRASPPLRLSRTRNSRPSGRSWRHGRRSARRRRLWMKPKRKPWRWPASPPRVSLNSSLCAHFVISHHLILLYSTGPCERRVRVAAESFSPRHAGAEGIAA